MINQNAFDGFVSASDIIRSTAKKGRAGRSSDPMRITVSINKNKSTDTNNSFQFRIGLGIGIVRKARWQKGDRIEFLFNRSTKKGIIRRVQTGGYSLSQNNKGKGSSFSLQITWRPGMPWIDEIGACEDAEFSETGILFSFPPEIDFYKGHADALDRALSGFKSSPSESDLDEITRDIVRQMDGKS